MLRDILKSKLNFETFITNKMNVYVETFMFQGHVNYSYQAYIGKNSPHLVCRQHVVDCGWHRTKDALETALTQISVLLAQQKPSFSYGKPKVFRTWGNYVRSMHACTRNGTRKLDESNINNIRAIGSLNTEWALHHDQNWYRPEAYNVIQHICADGIFYVVKGANSSLETCYTEHILRKLGKEWLKFHIKRKHNPNWKKTAFLTEEGRVKRLVINKRLKEAS